MITQMRRKTSIRTGLRDLTRYHFDNLLSRGTWAVLLFLGAVTLAALVLSALLLALAGVTFAGSEGTSFVEDLWQSMLRVIDPGTMAADVSWGTRLLALLVTMFGVLIAGTLIGLIASGVEQRVEEMQRGRSVVVESDHVLILGASPRLPVIVNQLMLAGRRRQRNAIVVLADADPRELRDDIRSLVTDTRGSRLVIRWGDPTRRSHLGIVGVQRARAVIVLANEDAESDAGVVKATLAVRAELDGHHEIPVVVELGDVENAESLSIACGGRIEAVVPPQTIARITAFALGGPGLSQVIEELLDFRGADIYLSDVGELAGSSFAASIFRFAKAHPIGVINHDGVVQLNPAPQTTLAKGDRLVVLADDGRPLLEPGSSATGPEPTEQPSWLPDQRVPKQEHLLVIGWNNLGGELLSQLRRVVAPGSVEVVYDDRVFSADEMAQASAQGTEPATILTPSSVDTWHPPSGGTGLSRITSVMFLGYRRGHSVEEADSRTLLNVMLLKRELERRGGQRPRLIVELLNSDNVDLARMTGADDFLVSDAITSRLITQLADQPERRGVLLDLLGPDGPSVRLVEAEHLDLVGEFRWGEIVERVYSGGLLAIGWRRSSSSDGEMLLNPASSERATLESRDHVVVVG